VTFRRRLRVVRRRFARAIRPSRLIGSVTLVVALGVTVWLLVLVVSENAVAPTASTTAPTSLPKTTTAPKTGTTQPKSTTAPSTEPKKVATPTPAAPTIPLGVYAGPGSPVAATAFSADAGAPVPYAFDYIDDSSWAGISNPTWFLQRWSGSGFRMIWGVPMLPKTGAATLAAGATGAYNVYFNELAQSLVDNGQAASVIVLGWDPQDPTVPWAVSNAADAVQYVAYWRQIVTTMRSVPGQQFTFAWDSAPGRAAVLPQTLYPGNAYVDVVATDAFDVGSSVVASGWNAFALTPYGPDWYSTFAIRHNKPFMIAKWGVVPTTQQGGGDSATFVDEFLHWADHQHLFAAVTWDYGTWAVTGGTFPKAEAALHSVAEAGAIAPEAKAVDS
jgi:hypothetical protein